MYPYNLFEGIQFNLYDLFLCVGIIVCLISFDRLADRYPIRYKMQTLCYISATAAIILGFGFAILAQALYNYLQNGGEFVIDASTGATFYGGLLGGAAVFLAVYFIAGRFIFPDKYHKRSFFSVANCAVPSILIAHSLGRVGCLMAGCCHGAETDAWYGLSMYVGGKWNNYVPTQLFEAVFLFLLFVFLFINAYRGGKYNLPIYMASYGVWRFIIEYVRDDYRGSIGIDALTPSQLIAIVMIVGAVGVFFLERWYSARLKARYAHIRPKASIPLICETEGGEESAEVNENN